MKKKSSVINIRRLWKLFERGCVIINEDLLTVFAAQASFFIIISAFPFFLLLLSLAKYIVDVDAVLMWIESRIAGDIGSMLKGVLSEIVGKTGISLVSLTAITTLWTSSRGVFAVTRGVSEVYGIRINENFIFDIVRSLIYTVSFMLIIIVSLIALVFGQSISNFAADKVPVIKVIFDVVESCSTIVFFCGLTLFFALVYNTAAKKGKRTAREKYLVLSEKLPRGFGAQLPGAAFAALGWVLFSYIYSLYIRYFPNASYIYGSIAAIVFLMLWLYSCMIILLVGAELNKLIFLIRRKNGQPPAPAKEPKKRLSLISGRKPAGKIIGEPSAGKSTGEPPAGKSIGEPPAGKSTGEPPAVKNTGKSPEEKKNQSK